MTSHDMTLHHMTWHHKTWHKMSWHRSATQSVHFPKYFGFCLWFTDFKKGDEKGDWTKQENRAGAVARCPAPPHHHWALQWWGSGRGCNCGPRRSGASEQLFHKELESECISPIQYLENHQFISGLSIASIRPFYFLRRQTCGSRFLDFQCKRAGFLY